MSCYQDVIAYLTEHGADEQVHSGHTLLDHLVGTYELLRQWDCRDELCIAGLCHSVYGTESFKSVIVEQTHRGELKQLTGEHAEYLSFLFCVHQKRSLWFNLVNARQLGYFSIKNRYSGEAIKIDEQTFADLAVITLANKLEQRPREDIALQNQLKREMIATKRLLSAKAWEAFRLAYKID